MYLDDPRGQVPWVISDDPRDLSPRVVLKKLSPTKAHRHSKTGVGTVAPDRPLLPVHRHLRTKE